jgi:hypothetical protein
MNLRTFEVIAEKSLINQHILKFTTKRANLIPITVGEKMHLESKKFGLTCDTKTVLATIRIQKRNFFRRLVERAKADIGSIFVFTETAPNHWEVTVERESRHLLKGIAIHAAELKKLKDLAIKCGISDTEISAAQNGHRDSQEIVPNLDKPDQKRRRSNRKTRAISGQKNGPIPDVS